MRHVALEPGTAYVVQATADVLDATFAQLVEWLGAATGTSPERRGREDR